jgi:hypothetical protein
MSIIQMFTIRHLGIIFEEAYITELVQYDHALGNLTIIIESCE